MGSMPRAYISLAITALAENATLEKRTSRAPTSAAAPVTDVPALAGGKLAGGGSKDGEATHALACVVSHPRGSSVTRFVANRPATQECSLPLRARHFSLVDPRAPCAMNRAPLKTGR